VVTAGGEDAAWVNRVDGGNINDPGWLGYGKNQDYAPFGSVVPPEPDNDPENWPLARPLYIESDNSISGYSTGFGNARAGAPYGMVDPAATGSVFECFNSLRLGTGCGPNASDVCNVYGTCVVDDTSFEETLFKCVYNNDFIFTSSCQTGEPCIFQAGFCVSTTRNGAFGPPTCVSGPNIGQECSENGNSDCGTDMESGEYGLCVGFKKPVGVADWDEFNRLMLTNSSEEHLGRIFAKSYRIFEWKFDQRVGEQKYRYMQLPDTSNFDFTSNGNPPQIKNMLVNGKNDSTEKGEDGQVVIIREGVATLKFDSVIDSNQTPLVRYTVYWGDGKESTETGLRIAGRDMSNPHILVHYYKYRESCNTNIDNNVCVFIPWVELEDNWGKTNTADSASSPEDHAGQVFAGEIRVYKN